MRAQESAELERLASQVSTARATAEAAGASRLGSAVFRDAEARRTSAEAVRATGDLGQARARYGEALRAYEAATAAARQAEERLNTDARDAQRAADLANQSKMSDAAAAGKRAADTRSAAEAAGAPRSAARTFALADEHARQGRAAESARRYDDAITRFRDAQRAYEAAKKEADSASAPVPAQPREATRQPDSATTGRLGTGPSGPDRPTVADARQAAARQEVEQLRADMSLYRAGASKAGAEEFARELFDDARAKEREGDRLLASLSLPEARRAYQQAVARYDEATVRAGDLVRARNEADRARTRMLAEKQLARPESADFAAALEQEKSANALYASRAFPGAAQRFGAAADLFLKSKRPPEDLERLADRFGTPADLARGTRPTAPPSPSPPVSAPAPPAIAPPGTAPKPAAPQIAAPAPPSLAPFARDESVQIKAILDDFKRAIESKDLALLRRIRPGLGADDVRRMRDTFDNTSDYTLDLHVLSIRIQGDVAYARAYRKDTFQAKDGQILRHENNATFTLRRTQERWTIEDIETVK